MNIDKLIKQIDDLFHDMDFENIFEEQFQDTYFNKRLNPLNNKNHIGIEIEFISKSKAHIIFNEFNKKLKGKFSLGNDGSIETDDWDDNSYELRLLDTEKNILKTLKIACEIFKKMNCYVNNTCGTHIHIDSRNRNKEKIFMNFIKSQRFLYKLVNTNRQNNSYCKSRDINTINNRHRPDEHYYGVSRSRRFNTIEIRMHEGCLDFTKLSQWINLLIKIANKRTDIIKDNVIPTSDVIYKKLKLKDKAIWDRIAG